MSGILGIGLKSLMAYQTAIEFTSQNLQNAQTPFYSRREISFVEAMFNNGVKIGDVNRVYSDLVNKSLLSAGSALSSASKFMDSISGLEKMLDSDTTGMSKYINDSLQSLQALTQDVSSSQNRAAFMAKLSNIAARMRQMGGDISQLKSNLNQDMTNTVETVNNLTQQIADMNNKISSLSPDERPGMLDKRNALAHQLAKYMDFTTYTDSNDNLQIVLSNGLEVVSGGHANSLSATPDPSDTTHLKLMMSVGNSQLDITDNINGGELYAMRRVKYEALDAVDQGLGRLAYALSSTFNAQNKLGIDSNGNLGTNIFTDMNATDLINNRVIPSSLNAGSGTFSVQINDADQLKLSDYQLVFSDPTHYTLTRLSDNSVMGSGAITAYPATIQADGFTATIASGSFQAGDIYAIKPMNNAMQSFNMTMTDPAGLALAFPVSVSPQTANTGQGTINVDTITDTTNAAFSINKQLNPPVKIVFLTDTSYQIMNANTNAVMEGPITYNPASTNSVFPSPGGYDQGYRISLNGNIKAGDTFNINYNTSVSGDNRNAIQLSNLYTAKVLNNGGMTFTEAYNFTAGDISSKTNFAKSDYESARILYNQTNLRYNEISGVSNIEEMSNLAEYQQGYQSCAQVIQVAKTVFDTIINLIR